MTWLKLECRAINPLEETLQLIRVVTKLNTPSESQFGSTIRLLNVFPNMGILNRFANGVSVGG